MAEESAERKRWIDRERQKIMDSVNALIEMRERYVEEHQQQQAHTTCDSGMGTSVGDSESEAESMNEQVPQNREILPQQGSGSNKSSEDGEDNIYNYGGECDDEEDVSSSSDDDDEEEDEFMKDRQTDEDYSAYRERIFDFTPKGYRHKKSLVEEMPIDQTPSTSRVSEVTTTSNIDEGQTKLMVQETNKEEPSSTDDTSNVPTYNNKGSKKRNARNEGSFDFQMLVQHMSKAEGIDIPNKEATNINPSTSNQQNSEGLSAGDEQEETEKSYLEKEREILVAQATERVKKIDMSSTSLTFDEYMTSYDKPSVTNANTEQNGEQVDESTGDMTKNIDQSNTVKENDYAIAKDKTLKDIMKENNVIIGESDSDDSESSEDEEQNASGCGDGHPMYRLRKPEDIKEAIRATLLRNLKKSDDVQNVCKWGSGSAEIQVRNEAANEEENTIETNNKEDKEENSSTSTVMNGDETATPKQEIHIVDGIQEVDGALRNKERQSAIVEANNTEVDNAETKGTNSNIEEETSDECICNSGERKDLVKNEEKQTETTEKVNNVKSSNRETKEEHNNTDLNVNKTEDVSEELKTTNNEENDDEKLREMTQMVKVEPTNEECNNVCTDLNKINEQIKSAYKNFDGIDESDESSDDEEKPFYMKLDKSDTTILKQIEDSAEEASAVKSKEEIKEELTGDAQETNNEEQDVSYREILEWEIRVPDENVQILLPIQRNKPKENPSEELSEILAQTSKKDSPEFKITPPRDIAEENDKIMYPRNIKRSMCYMSYKSMLTETGKTADVQPPLVHKVLKLSQNYPVFQKNQEEVITNEIKEVEKPPENSLLMCNKISEVRVQMSQFTKTLDDFNERSRLARQKIINDYNSAVERELKVVDRIMKMGEKSFNKRPALDVKKKRNVDFIDDNVFRKHYEDMGMIIEEEGDDGEEELRETVEKINKKYFNDVRIAASQTSLEDEYVLTKVPADGTYEERHTGEKRDKEKEEKGIVLTDNESYEDCLTTNEEDAVKDKNISEINENNNNGNEIDQGICEEYVLTNEEEEAEEFYEADDANEEDLKEILTRALKEGEENANEERLKESIKFAREEIEENDKEELDEFYNNNDKEAAASTYEEKETDDKAFDDLEKCEKPIVKRTVNCSLEMQLAKKCEGDD